METVFALQLTKEELAVAMWCLEAKQDWFKQLDPLDQSAGNLPKAVDDLYARFSAAYDVLKRIGE